jgi:hypothetical protein
MSILKVFFAFIINAIEALWLAQPVKSFQPEVEGVLNRQKNRA